MIKKEYFIKRQDSEKSAPVALSVLSVSPDYPASPKYVLQIVHGLCDRKERYLPLMEAVAASGGMAVIHDLRGYGNTVRSADELGDFGDFGYNYEILSGDIDAVYASVQVLPDDGELIECDYNPEIDIPDVPRYLLGFSLGALIVSVYLSKNTDTAGGAVFAGLPHSEKLISAKLLRLNLLSLFTGDCGKPKSLYRKMTRRYSTRFPLHGEPDVKYLWYSADPANRMELISDPVCDHRKTTAAHISFCRLLRDTYRPSAYNKPRKDMPVLIMAGEFDPEAGGERKVLASAKFYSDMGFSPIDIKMYRGMRHEIFRDISREIAFADVISFCEKHLDAENARIAKIRGEYESVFSTEGGADSTPDKA